LNQVQYIYDESISKVYNTLIRISHSLTNKVRVDRDNYRIHLTTSASLFSYGEEIEILVSKKNKKTLVTIEGSAKVFFNLTANANKYIDKIVEKLNQVYKGEMYRN
jgi:hypothetical protein